MKRSIFKSIRTKLIVSFLVVALIPLLLLAFINKQTTEKALTDNARQALSAEATETAHRIDEFIDGNLNAVRRRSDFTRFGCLSGPTSRTAK
jgi:sigma-B regulation protein RsbU (phosphoserine phosphatase)